MKGFANRLKIARKAKGLTQLQVADKLHIHRTAYTKYERGVSEPTLETLVKITAVLDVSADTLLFSAE